MANRQSDLERGDSRDTPGTDEARMDQDEQIRGTADEETEDFDDEDEDEVDEDEDEGTF